MRGNYYVDRLVYGVSDKHDTALVMNPGETITLKLQNAYGKSFSSVEEFEAFLSDDNKEEKKRLNHPCTGPIEVRTDQENISLAIQILDSKATRGYQSVSKSTGFLKDEYTMRSCDVIDIADDQKLKFKDGDLILKTHPKLGFIATLDHEDRSPGRACENGGNIDLNYLDKGSIIYLPVNNDRARFLVGDLHACQGNGEAAGIAIEADGEVTLKVDIVDKINFPVIDDKHRMIIVGWGASPEQCFKQATENTIEYFKRVFPFCDWEEVDIYKFISAEGNLVLGNSTGNVVTCGMVFYKKRLFNKYNFPVFG